MSAYPENDYRGYLEHSAKGTHWSKPNHKYIAIKNGRYIYPEDLKKNSSSRKFDVNTAVVTRSGGSSSDIKPANLKAKPGATSSVDVGKTSGTTSYAGRPKGRTKAYTFTKKSSSKNWSVKKGTVKKGKKTNLKKKLGKIYSRPL